jgi:hypothetical protein
MTNDQSLDRETFDVLANFVGQTYNEICKFDQSLISTNNNLTSKREQFKNIAESVLSIPNPNNGNAHRMHHQNEQMPANQMAYVDRGIAPLAPPADDPNQLEFKFDNSEISQKIEKKFDTIINRINRIDKTLTQLLEFLNYEAEDTES